MAKRPEIDTGLWGGSGGEAPADAAAWRSKWFAALAEEKRQQLFELEVLLRGLGCYIDQRNRSDATQGGEGESAGGAGRLSVIAATLISCVQLADGLTGRAVEVLPSGNPITNSTTDSLQVTGDVGHARAAGTLTDGPETALRSLCENLASLGQLLTALTASFTSGVPIDTAIEAAVHRLLRNALQQSPFFHPPRTFELGPDFDRIRDKTVLALLQRIEARPVQRIVAVTYVSLARLQRMLELLRSYGTSQGTQTSLYPGKALVVVAVIANNTRRLARFLDEPAARTLAAAYAEQVDRLKAVQVDARTEAQLAARASSLMQLRNSLCSIGLQLSAQLRVWLLQGLATHADTTHPTTELLVAVDGSQRCVDIAMQKLLAVVAEDCNAKADAATNTATAAMISKIGVADWRGEVWIWSRIMQAFVEQALAFSGTKDLWADDGRLSFARDFADYLRGLGYGLLRTSNYPRLDQWVALGRQLRHVDTQADNPLSAAVDECDRCFLHLQSWLSKLSDNSPAVDFDTQHAARCLRVYVAMRREATPS